MWDAVTGEVSRPFISLQAHLGITSRNIGLEMKRLMVSLPDVALALERLTATPSVERRLLEASKKIDGWTVSYDSSIFVKAYLVTAQLLRLTHPIPCLAVTLEA